ncbi:MAG: lasso peptide isopeptide bond-forming cyclase [Pyrinomonadaceae bacterium]
MSAIAGVYCLDGRPASPDLLEEMLTSLAHRGPDGSGLWCGGPTGLGQRMLRTTPESFSEKLPFYDGARRLAITADARIDNRRELISALAVPELTGAEIPDSLLILAAYEKWGEQCPERLLGDFAFAVWDEKRRVLFCARDHVGAKPFYFHAGRSFVFATEIKALFRHPEVPRRINEARVADHLAGLFGDQNITFYQDIYRLPAAHGVTVGPQGTRIQRYWSLAPSRELRLGSDSEYAEAFKELFTEAVRCRQRAAFPVGSTLSGGLDSSSIGCTAREVFAADGNRPVHTFSAIFPGLPKEVLPRLDERRYVDAVLSKGGFEPHFVRADLLSPLTDVDKVLWHEDEAVNAPNLYLHWGIYDAARRRGVRVLLDGFDGDTTVSHGFERLTELAATGRWRTLASEARALSKNVDAFFTPRRIIWYFGFRPLVPGFAVQTWRALRVRPKSDRPTDSVVHPEFARRIGLADRIRDFDDGNAALTSRESHRRALNSPLISYTLEIADKAAAAFALEARYPFFDRRLMEFCLALPSEQKLSRGWTRAVMRRALDGILPREVQWRMTKADLSPNFNLRLLDYDRGILEAVILQEPQIIERFVDVASLRAAYKRYAAHPARSSQDAITVYNAVMLALWLRQEAHGSAAAL